MTKKDEIGEGWWEKFEGRISLARLTHRWEDNIKIDHRETGCDTTDRMYLAQDEVQWRSLVKTVIQLRVP
jgi:hypothetical protein